MNEAYMIKYEQLVISNDFSQIMKFIKELQTDVTEEKINWYFHLLKDKRNMQLFLTLRAFFDKYGDVGKLFLLDYLKKSKDVALTAEAIILLSGHNYQCKEVLPYVYKFITDEDEELRYRSIIALGWIGDEKDFDKLKERVENESSISNKGYALSAMRQMFFRMSNLKPQILEIYHQQLTAANNDEIILIVGLCVQDLLKKRLNIKEDEKGVHSNDNPETLRAKALKLLEKELLR